MAGHSLPVLSRLGCGFFLRHIIIPQRRTRMKRTNPITMMEMRRTAEVEKKRNYDTIITHLFAAAAVTTLPRQDYRLTLKIDLTLRPSVPPEAMACRISERIYDALALVTTFLTTVHCFKNKYA